MKISELYKPGKTVISFEIFPPKKDDGIDSLYRCLDELKCLKPEFISVTYSAGGSGGSEKTFTLAETLKNKYGIEPLVHMTCLNSKRAEIDGLLKNLSSRGLCNIMALRGDIVPGTDPGRAEYKFAKDLIGQIHSSPYEFCIGGAAYAEGHVDCDDFDLSICHLKEKQDAGADFFTSQLFFDNTIFYRFLDAARKKGISVPISAGIMPILSKGQVERMIYMCGVSLPSAVVRILNRYSDDAESLRKASIEYAGGQIHDLAAHGVDGVHIYTMNKSKIAGESLGVAAL